MSNEEKTNDYENFEKGMIYMKILKKGGEEETKSMPHAPVLVILISQNRMSRFNMSNKTLNNLVTNIDQKKTHISSAVIFPWFLK